MQNAVKLNIQRNWSRQVSLKNQSWWYHISISTLFIFVSAVFAVMLKVPRINNAQLRIQSSFLCFFKPANEKNIQRYVQSMTIKCVYHSFNMQFLLEVVALLSTLLKCSDFFYFKGLPMP